MQKNGIFMYKYAKIARIGTPAKQSTTVTEQLLLRRSEDDER